MPLKSNFFGQYFMKKWRFLMSGEALVATIFSGSKNRSGRHRRKIRSSRLKPFRARFTAPKNARAGARARQRPKFARLQNSFLLAPLGLSTPSVKICSQGLVGYAKPRRDRVFAKRERHFLRAPKCARAKKCARAPISYDRTKKRPKT